MNFVSYYLAEIAAQTSPTSQQVESGFGYVIAAFVVIWLFIAAYLFWLHRRQESLRSEVEILRQEEAERRQQLETGYQPESGRPDQATAGRRQQELGG